MNVHLDERERVHAAYARRDAPERYAASQPDQIALRRARARAWADALARRTHVPGEVLEAGCGTGSVARWAADLGATSVIGVDVIEARLGSADRRDRAVHYVLGDARDLPLRHASLDTVICSTLFSSILDDGVASSVAAELDRVLAPGGAVLWFDFFRDNPRNPDVRAVGADDVRRLFPGYESDLERVVLAPPIARRLRHGRLIAAAERITALRTHLAGALWKPRA